MIYQYEYGFDKTNGLNHTIEVSDVNNDGYQDIVIGNHGLNSRLKASEKYPLTMLVNDFDNNGNVDALSDGLVVLRYLFGVRGASLIEGVVANDAMRTDAEDIEAYIESLMPEF